MYTPLYPIFIYSGGIPTFRIFDPKCRLWVLVRTAFPRRTQRVPKINVLSKNIKNVRIFKQNFQLLQLK